MPKRGAAALVITTVALVLLLNFKTPEGGNPRAAGSPAPQASTSAARAPDAGNPRAAGSPAPQASTSGAKAVDGPVVSTRYGDVQVEISVSDGALRDVVALQLPTGRRSGSISDYAAPMLRSEALQAQSATIDIVSGATYTSLAYARSLQAALDLAGR
jgi:uncharacterized protein with FMN-binding domain